MGNYDFKFVDDNGTISYVCAKCRSEAIEIYCREKGCSKEYVKDHVVIRHTNLSRSTKR